MGHMYKLVPTELQVCMYWSSRQVIANIDFEILTASAGKATSLP